jgi:hypothetical protein
VREQRSVLSDSRDCIDKLAHENAVLHERLAEREKESVSGLLINP